MNILKNRLLAIALCGMAFSLAQNASAANLVINGDFETTLLSNKGNFSGNVPGWSGGSNLTFLDFPGTADGAIYLAVYGPFPATSPNGGNFVEADGDPNFSSTFSQTISGLTIGQHYQLDFFQAAGQQTGFNGATTERWSVTFGAENQLSDMFSLPSHGIGPWEAQTMTFTATMTSQVLSFLAVGTPGGGPPISFLDGVTLDVSPVPEPSTFLAGAFLAGGAALRRYRKNTKIA